MDHLPYLLADSDFYRPIEEAAPSGVRYEAGALPAGWRQVPKGVWTVCSPPAGISTSHGWKVHVSASLERAQSVLHTASAICVAQGVAFKHLSNALCYTWLHHKHGSRAQSGKFIAAYPEDVPAAERLMAALTAALAGERGPHILGDRRYRGSRVVAYRYGAFAEIGRLLPDGTRELLVPDGHGELVPDRRGVAFTLPEGITDPFVLIPAPAPAPEEAAAGHAPAQVAFAGLRFTRLIRHSNGGGAYVAVESATGLEVFVKEARGHGGLHFDASTAQDRLAHEWEMLTELHTALPGLAPVPVAHFQRWEHTFLVTELVPGDSLLTWALKNLPGIRTEAGTNEHETYHRRCLAVFEELSAQIDALHAAGYVFVDLSANNVLVDDDDRVRLIDFEASGRIGEQLSLLGTPGYFPDQPRHANQELARRDPCHFDAFGLSGIAKLLLAGPLHHVLEREPAAMVHLRHHLWQERNEPTPPPERLWQAAHQFVPAAPATALPTPQQVAADPVGRLRELQRRTADALVAMERPEAEPVFPTVVHGYASNVRSVAYGTAGVLHALRLAGRASNPAVLGRLARSSLERAGQTPPGLHTGNAGIAWVLADHGLIGEANELLDTATAHPILRQRATLGEGTAGVALAHLALYRHDQDERHLDEALRLRRSLPDGAELADLLATRDATGLLHGRPGIALVDHYLHRLGLDDGALGRGLELLRTELAFGVPYPHRGLGFPVSAEDRRNFIYLARGSVGFATVATRFLPDIDPEVDAALVAAVPETLATATTPFTIYGGLYDGRAGQVLALAEHASLTGSAAGRSAAFTAARKLFCYAVDHPTGVRFLGEGFARFSADLASGSAGVLLALTRLLDDRADTFFTLDTLDTIGSLDTLDSSRGHAHAPELREKPTAGRIASPLATAA